MGFEVKIIVCFGISEDVVLFLVYEKGVELIVLVGFYSSMFDFLEKGWKGMLSIFLVRLKIGLKFVDVWGVFKFYIEKVSFKYIGVLLFFVFIFIFVIFMVILFF